MASVTELVNAKMAELDKPGRPTMEVQYPPKHLDEILSPSDGSFEPLAQKDSPYFAGCMPALGIFVEFALLDDPDTLLQGFYGELSNLGPLNKHRGAFIVIKKDEEIGQIYFPRQVCKWREVIRYEELSPVQLEFTKTVIPHAWHGSIDCNDDDMKVDWRNHSWQVKQALVYTVIMEAYPEQAKLGIRPAMPAELMR